jgi:hypothetical protein
VSRCVWELFSLFTFCYGELALERIKIISIEGADDPLEALVEMLRRFSFDEAHCFGE